MGSKAVDYRSSRIAQTKEFGAFVKGFAYSIIYCSSDDCEIEKIIYSYNLRVASGNQQGKKWETGWIIFLTILTDKVRENVAVQVVDIH